MCRNSYNGPLADRIPDCLCLLEGIAGWLLWAGHKSGAILALALLPPGAIYGGDLHSPLAPTSAIVRTIPILLSWQNWSDALHRPYYVSGDNPFPGLPNNSIEPTRPAAAKRV